MVVVKQYWADGADLCSVGERRYDDCRDVYLH